MTTAAIRMLASVRTRDEAIAAAAAGADLIDLKEPRSGALGALPLPQIAAIVAALRARWPALPVSATIGDLPRDGAQWMAQRVTEVAATGVDYVKVGIERSPQAAALLEQLAVLPGTRVPVLLADRGLDMSLVQLACDLAFPVVMVDTADKHAGSLFDCVDRVDLQRLLRIVRDRGLRAGLAGSLRLAHVPLLRELAPDIAGFRGALCAGARTDRLDPVKAKALRAALRGTGSNDAPAALSSAQAL